MILTGGCLCGAIRYEISLTGAEVVDYCHCRQCRTASGAPVLAWIQVPPAAFRPSGRPAKAFASSSHAARWFCPECGGQIYMTDDAGRSVGITLGTVDDAAALRPAVHGWNGERLPWFNTRDDLPRYPASPPYDL